MFGMYGHRGLDPYGVVPGTGAPVFPGGAYGSLGDAQGSSSAPVDVNQFIARWNAAVDTVIEAINGRGDLAATSGALFAVKREAEDQGLFERTDSRWASALADGMARVEAAGEARRLAMTASTAPSTAAPPLLPRKDRRKGPLGVRPTTRREIAEARAKSSTTKWFVAGGILLTVMVLGSRR